MIERKIKKLRKELDFYIEEKNRENAYKTVKMIDKLIIDLISESEEINFGRHIEI